LTRNENKEVQSPGGEKKDPRKHVIQKPVNKKGKGRSLRSGDKTTSYQKLDYSPTKRGFDWGYQHKEKKNGFGGGNVAFCRYDVKASSNKGGR